MEQLYLAEPSDKYQKSFENYALSYKKIKDDFYFNIYMKALEDFRGYINYLHNCSKGIDLPKGWVPCSTFWLIDNDEVVGVVRIRHKEVTCCGHIGYDISPYHRGEGFGTAILKLGIKKAKELDMKEVIVTCSVNNKASKKVIEKNGGKLLGIISDEDNTNCYKYSIITSAQ